jgi:hypothetical protein
MPDDSASRDGGPTGRPLTARTLVLVLAFYSAALTVATWPMARDLSTALPGSLTDTLQHLWIMRWYRACLFEGRSPLICPDVQFPVGAPLGNFSPLHAEALAYVPLSIAIGNDVLCFNLIWAFGLLLTGLGTFLLAYQGVRDRTAAAVGGLLAMLSGPVLLHAQEHLELIQLGTIPLFLMSWLRFIDRPSGRRWALAVALYLVLAFSAAYYAVFAAIPAAGYVAWEAIRALRRRERSWLRSRTAWVAGFAMATAPVLAIAFLPQLWSLKHGWAIARPLAEFEQNAAPPWTYSTPTPLHALGRLLPFDAYAAAGIRVTMIEQASYLGLLTLGLVFYAAVHGLSFARSKFWWAMLALLLILSFGASWQIGDWKIPLPAFWLKKSLFFFAMIRWPSRFNLLVAVVAALPASAALRHLRGRIPNRVGRGAVTAALVAAAVADLSTLPFPNRTVPPIPPCYAEVLKHDPAASFLDIPQFFSGGTHHFNALCAYWQSLHGGKTSGGYSGNSNVIYDNLVFFSSPFAISEMGKLDYLDQPERTAFDVAKGVHFLDYAWLYLKAHDYRYVVLHQWPGALTGAPGRADHLKAELASSKVFEDAMTAVYARDRLPLPRHPVWLCTAGWRQILTPEHCRAVERAGQIAVYNPDAGQDLRFLLHATAFRRPRTVRLISGGRELARFAVDPGPSRLYTVGPFRLPAGLQTLTLQSDGDDRPVTHLQATLHGQMTPYSLRVDGLALIDAHFETARR